MKLPGYCMNDRDPTLPSFLGTAEPRVVEKD